MEHDGYNFGLLEKKPFWMTYQTFKIQQSPPVEVEETVILHICYFAMKLEFSAFHMLI